MKEVQILVLHERTQTADYLRDSRSFRFISIETYFHQIHKTVQAFLRLAKS